jgi:hypothetical protein
MNAGNPGRCRAQAALAVLALAALGNAWAGEPGVARAWHDLAAADAAAALALIEENHPAAAPELGDKVFLARLAQARTHVAERLPKVSTYGGYSALMNGLAAEFGDGHIRAGAQVHFRVGKWAGLLPVRRGGRWVVGLQEAAAGEADVRDAEIVACDGVPFDRWARARIGQFGGDAQLEAELARRAPAMLLDDANPFLAKPVACTFRLAAGGTQQLALSWRPVLAAALDEKIGKIVKRPSPGMGIQPFAGGYWINLGNLGPAASKVVQAAQEQHAALLSAPMVVVDMRGNGGGNSAYAVQLARILQGEARVNALDVAGNTCSGQHWRASPDNLANIKGWRDQAVQRGDKDTAAWYEDFIGPMEQALASKRSFAPDLPACAAATAAQRPHEDKVPDAVTAAMKGRLVLVTDRYCFSSCLIATSTFRRLGAQHVGETTDRGTRYMEVREIMLPSGMRTFSTMQKVALSASDYGPYEPEIVYPGDLADDTALQKWVADLGKR